MIAPVLEGISTSQPTVTVAKIDVDAHPAIAEKYQVTALPTVAAFKNGALKEKFLGARDKKFIEAFITSTLQ